MNNITPDVKHHAKIVNKYLKLRRRLVIVVWIIGLIYVPLGTMLAGHSLYTSATELMAKETEHVSEEQEAQDWIQARTAELVRASTTEALARLRDDKELDAIAEYKAKLEARETELQDKRLKDTLNGGPSFR